MTNTKLCSECRHEFNEECGRTMKEREGYYIVSTTFGERENFYGCGTEAKHFEPIGGADGQD